MISDDLRRNYKEIFNRDVEIQVSEDGENGVHTSKGE